MALGLGVGLFLLVGPAAAWADDANPVAGARALSEAFRQASRRATPSVVTVLTYGKPSTPPVEPSPQPGGIPATPPGNGDDDDSTDGDTSDDDFPGGNTPGRTDSSAGDTERLSGIGSGVIVQLVDVPAETGVYRVITNNHVIRGATRVVIQLSDDTRYDAIERVGDPQSDVAVVSFRVDDDDNDDADVVAAQIGDSRQVEIGDWVLAIGSPFKLEATVSAGIISAKNRQLRTVPRSRLFQTDAAINPGNSGGPLVDLDGRVVAINTAIATRSGGYQGIGFAIPINQATWVASELVNGGRVRRAAIGVTMAELNRRIARMFDLRPNSGVLAYEIVADSAAQRAGLKPLDVITKFDGEAVRNPSNLRELIEQTPIGETRPIEVLRKGETLVLSITMASIEDPTLDGSDNSDGGADSIDSDEADTPVSDDPSASVDDSPQ